MNIKFFSCITFLLCLSAAANCQVNSASDSMPPHKNVIRASITQPLLFGNKNFILGYERVLTPHQSISINGGFTGLPKIVSIDLDSISVNKESNARGYNVSLDYRFYLKKENKYLAPRGVYIGPYAFIYTFNRDNNWNYQNNGIAKDFSTQTKINIIGGGFELGYQFLFWKRITLDLVLIGPGLASYSFEAKLTGNLDVDEESDVVNALKAWVDDKFPGSNIVWGDKEVNANGKVRTTTVGFRYLIQIGYNF